MLRTTPHVTTDAIRAVGWSRRGMPPPCGATRATADMMRRIRMRTSSRAFAARQRVEVRVLVGPGGVSASTSLFRVFLSLPESGSIVRPEECEVLHRQGGTIGRLEIESWPAPRGSSGIRMNSKASAFS
jgi:hypothetical protein